MRVYRPSNEGFTFLEGLVALGLALGMLSGTISDSVARAGRVAPEERAVVLADSLLAGLGRDMPLRPGVTGGRKDGLVWRFRSSANPGPRTAHRSTGLDPQKD